MRIDRLEKARDILFYIALFLECAAVIIDKSRLINPSWIQQSSQTDRPVRQDQKPKKKTRSAEKKRAARLRMLVCSAVRREDMERTLFSRFITLPPPFLCLRGFYPIPRILVNGVYRFITLKTFEKQSAPLSSGSGYVML